MHRGSKLFLNFWVIYFMLLILFKCHWHGITLELTKLFAFFLYFTIILGPELLPPPWKYLPVSEGLRIRYHRDLLSSAPVLSILDQDTILGIFMMNREHRKKYSAVLFGSYLFEYFVFSWSQRPAGAKVCDWARSGTRFFRIRVL